MTWESMPVLELLDSFRRDQNPAASELYRRYHQRLLELARRRLDARTKRKEDPEDVVQSVFRSFFRRHSRGELVVQDEDRLFRLLVAITVHKCAKRVRYFRRARRDVKREAHLPGSSDDSTAQGDMIGDEPSPEEALLLLDTVGKLMRGLDSRDREIVELCLQGYTVREIGEKLPVTERKVRILLKQVERRLNRWLTEG
jgi:RNA polymerase sigma-70 factor (ECF subfamily)